MNDFLALRRTLLSRQGFLGLVSVGVAGVAGVVVGIPILGYLLGPVIQQPKNVWREVRLANPDGTPGRLVSVDTIGIGQTVKVLFANPQTTSWSGATGKDAAWLRRRGQETFTAFSIHCTHLGCPVSWLQEGQIFLCPCHGSVFNADGTVASPPAVRPLTQHPVRLVGSRVQLKTEALPVVF
jgi:menaquinol-cytochrome c reductase iron-sulfur subunit